ncbi:unnamed protein product [Effrenium voratum]|uniref:Uncharacterized protein n=1 Tax=Effrenium voratum TaxID=2562239 RepID=A0AA36NA88_9DINO|nr:unnamed protein product [Effrenium voratum]CAJ1396051.1 unnamed protein product [Effrenium voratum]CAJ1419570.1 unnamed protein product [Effrenium voratum]
MAAKSGASSAFTWLRQGLTETVTPKGRLRPNLFALKADQWIHFDPSEASRHLRVKREIFASEASRPKYLLQKDGSQKAQREVLEMLLDHLPAYYPENFQVRASPSGGLEGGARGARFGPDTRVKVEAENWRAEYVLGDYEEFPLELASNLVMEDLVLMQDSTLVAGSVLFSFSRFQERFGLDMEQIHHKVPQYAQDLQKPVSRVFATLTEDRPMWRSNWNISWTDDILAGYGRYPHRNPGISVEDRNKLFSELIQSIDEKGLSKSAWLKVEYQTLRRLTANPDCLLFTVRTFLNSFQELAQEPLAAKALLRNLDRLERTEFSKYIGIDDAEVFSRLRDFVQECSA